MSLSGRYGDRPTGKQREAFLLHRRAQQSTARAAPQKPGGRGKRGAQALPRGFAGEHHRKTMPLPSLLHHQAPPPTASCCRAPGLKQNSTERRQKQNFPSGRSPALPDAISKARHHGNNTQTTTRASDTPASPPRTSEERQSTTAPAARRSTGLPPPCPTQPRRRLGAAPLAPACAPAPTALNRPRSPPASRDLPPAAGSTTSSSPDGPSMPPD